MTPAMRRNNRSATVALASLPLLLLLLLARWSDAFAIPRSLSHAATAGTAPSRAAASHLAASSDEGEGGGSLFFAEKDVEDAAVSSPPSLRESEDTPTATSSSRRLFDDSTLAEANDALSSVGWAGVAPMQGEGEMTSDDPFVKLIDEGVMAEMGVGLDGLLNPAKVVNLERDLYNLRLELAGITGVSPAEDSSLTTDLCDGGGGGDEADLIRSKISKKETDLSMERRAVFRGWLKDIFLAQAVISAGLSYVMATYPDALFGGFSWYTDVAYMDTSIMVLGFWWWWLFIVPSLRSRRPSGAEKRALDIAFLGTPLISLLSPLATKDTGLIWTANLAVVVGSYVFAYLVGEGDGGEGGGREQQPAWLKFVYKSLDFGSGKERGVRR